MHHLDERDQTPELAAAGVSGRVRAAAREAQSGVCKSLTYPGSRACLHRPAATSLAAGPADD